MGENHILCVVCILHTSEIIEVLWLYAISNISIHAQKNQFAKIKIKNVII